MTVRIGDQLLIDGGTVHCGTCEESIGPVSENFKRNLAVEQTGIADAGPHYDDPSRFVDEEMSFRKFYCPECGTMLFTETARPDDPIHDELTVETDGGN